MESSVTKTRPMLGVLENRLIKTSMRVMFAPVFGWRGPDAEDVRRFQVLGIDNSTLDVACFETDRTIAKGVVILCHPFLKYGMNYFFQNRYHQWLLGAGYHVVGFNFKGFGTSTLAGVSFADDVSSIASWARAKYQGLSLHLLGASFGGYHGVHALASKSPGISSAVLDSVPAMIASYFKGGLTGATMRWLSRSRWAEVTGTQSILTSLAAVREVPCLFLYGNRDDFIVKHEIECIKNVCKTAKTVMYENCSHLEIRKRYPDQYMQGIIEFYDAHGMRATGSVDG